jgi:hypothetical protein
VLIIGRLTFSVRLASCDVEAVPELLLDASDLPYRPRGPGLRRHRRHARWSLSKEHAGHCERGLGDRVQIVAALPSS